ncbi:MAG TPA: hypothetical protein VD999_03765 [Vitreimonas sp.]|nr:hypothetical protein [Vitreimonas sp.]
MSKENAVTFLDPFVISAYKHLVLGIDFRQAFADSVSLVDFEQKKEELLKEIDRRLLSGSVEDLGKLIKSMQITRNSNKDELQERAALERLENELGLTVEQASLVFQTCTQLNDQLFNKLWGISSQGQG